jgi:D-erythrulose 1-phosphate 3-epimerase
MTTFRLGINTCFAVKRWPLPSDWAPIVREDWGLDLVQHTLDLVDVQGGADLLDAEVQGVREACERYGLTLDSTFTGLAAYSSNILLDPRAKVRAFWEQWLGKAMEFTVAAGGRLTGGHIGAFSIPVWTDQERRAQAEKELADALERLTRRAKDLGLEGVYVENMAVAREPSTMAQVEELLSEGDRDHAPRLLCLDVGHECVVGSEGAERDPYAWLKHFGPRLGCVHIQQSDAEADHHWPFIERFNQQGRIAADRLLDVLEETGADEVKLFLEVIPSFEQDDGQVLAELGESVRYWQSALAARAAVTS